MKIRAASVKVLTKEISGFSLLCNPDGRHKVHRIAGELAIFFFPKAFDKYA
jgi:hypothetical protein